MALKKEVTPMANYQIARRLNKHPAQTFKRVTLMAQNKILQVIDGYPKFYKLNASNQAQSFIILTIECPKCKIIHIRHQSQTTVQCSCKTGSGKPTRFYVYNSRIKNKRILGKQEELTDQEEMEHDVNDIMLQKSVTKA